MDYPSIKPSYTSRGIECNENDLLNKDNGKKFDLSIMKNAFFQLRNTKVNKGVFYIKKRIDLINPLDNRPKFIYDKANLDKYIQQCTVSNFNNKYHCLLYQKNKDLMMAQTSFNKYSRNVVKTKSNVSRVNKNKANKSLPILSLNTTVNDRGKEKVNDMSVFENIKQLSLNRNKISIKCIKKVSLLNEI